MTVPVNPELRAYAETVAARYEALAADLRRFLAEGYPKPTDDMPLLDNYTIGARTVPCLVGSPFGHPRLPATERAKTSAVVLPGLLHGVARTESRWYRLGQRIEQIDLDRLARQVAED